MKKEDYIRSLNESIENKTTETLIAVNNSTYSKQYVADVLQKECETLQRVFDIPIDEGKFEEAISGKERNRIMTTHSSALLALLCFHSVSEKKPLTIDGVEYTEAHFEVKNNVIDKSGRPSHVDVLLISKNKTILLFLESKFTEYAKRSSCYAVSKKYEAFYKNLHLEWEEPSFAFEISDYSTDTGKKEYGFHMRNGKRTTQYLEGIKQAFCHLIGICTKPVREKGNFDGYSTLLENAKQIKFTTIVHNWNDENNEFCNNYQRLYEQVFCKNNQDSIKECLQSCTQCTKILIEKLDIQSKLITYQDIFRKFELPKKVKAIYLE